MSDSLHQADCRGHSTSSHIVPTGRFTSLYTVRDAQTISCHARPTCRTKAPPAICAALCEREAAVTLTEPIPAEHLERFTSLDHTTYGGQNQAAGASMPTRAFSCGEAFQ